jgi:hypothetical protein
MNEIVKKNKKNKKNHNQMKFKIFIYETKNFNDQNMFE